MWRLHCKTLDLGGMKTTIEPPLSLERYQHNSTPFTWVMPKPLKV